MQMTKTTRAPGIDKTVVVFTPNKTAKENLNDQELKSPC